MFCPFPNPLSHAYVYGEVPPLAVALKLNVDPTQPDLSAPASTVGPVSYTHLDVYKRQRLYC